MTSEFTFDEFYTYNYCPVCNQKTFPFKIYNNMITMSDHRERCDQCRPKKYIIPSSYRSKKDKKPKKKSWFDFFKLKEKKSKLPNKETTYTDESSDDDDNISLDTEQCSNTTLKNPNIDEKKNHDQPEKVNIPEKSSPTEVDQTTDSQEENSINQEEKDKIIQIISHQYDEVIKTNQYLVLMEDSDEEKWVTSKYVQENNLQMFNEYHFDVKSQHQKYHD